MITADDKAKRNYERVKRWREKHRALLNLRRRQAYLRKKNLSGVVENALTNSNRLITGEDGGGEKEKSEVTKPTSESSASPAKTSRDSTLEYLRGLERSEREKTRIEVPTTVKVVRRSETGMIITEEQWQAREEYKRRANEKGFVPDEYAQA